MASKWYDPEILAKVRAGAMKGVVRACEEVRNEMISLILDTGKSGRVYRRRGVTHQASAEGEPPASDTGRLVNSISTTYDVPNLVGIIGVHDAKAAFLELGTQNMGPRPFARPALSNKADEIGKIVQAEVAAALK